MDLYPPIIIIDQQASMRDFLSFILFSILFIEPSLAQHSRLQRQGITTQLIVDSKPFLILGGELGNSSATCLDDIKSTFPKLQQIGLNTVLVPVYWELIEPTEGNFNFTRTDSILSQARMNNLKVVFLWFGAWKNSMSCYTPSWFKEDYTKYPRAKTEIGKPLEIASLFSEEVYRADNRAFSEWLKHVAEIDKNEGTVIMIQIENEIGMLESARDHSQAANELFKANVPSEFMEYIQQNKKELHPWLSDKWASNGHKQSGNWQEVFGTDIYTDELFMAWYYAEYVGRLAHTARSIYDVPLYVNAAMNSRDRKPGEYPSAGPLAHLIDLWHCAAPDIDFIAPDLYDKGFKNWVAKYHLHNNPLFIPEIRLTDDNGVRAFYVFGEHHAIGISPFSIEDSSSSPNSPLTQSYAKLKELMPILTKYQEKGSVKGLLFNEQSKDRIIEDEDLRVTCRHYFTLPWDPRANDGSTWPEGGGILIKLAENDYIVAGSGIVLEFAKKTELMTQKAKVQLGEDGFTENGKNTNNIKRELNQKLEGWSGTRCGISFVSEVKVDKNGNLHEIRRLNGDQTHQGRHVRISVGEFKILHVKLYEYK